LLVGRVRLIATTIEKLPTEILRDAELRVNTKAQLLCLAIEKTFGEGVDDTHELIKRVFSSFSKDEYSKRRSELEEDFIDKIESLSLSSSIKDRLMLPTQDQFDVVGMGLTVAAEVNVGQVTYQSEELLFKYYTVREEMVVRACVRFLALHRSDTSMTKAVYEQLIDHLQQHQFTDSAHGKLFERCVMASICQMTQGKKMTVSQLPFLSEDCIGKDVKLPDWTKEVQVDIDSYGTARELQFADDIAVVNSMISSGKKILLMPLNAMGNDGITLLHGTGKVLFPITISVKMYSEGVPWKEHLKSFKTTDPTWSYSQEIDDLLEKAGVDENIDRAKFSDLNKQVQQYFKKTDKTKTFQKLFEKSPIGGILRIHVEWTCPQGCPDLRVIVTGNEVLVWITMQNIEYLIPELQAILSGYLAKDVFERKETKKRKLKI